MINRLFIVHMFFLSLMGMQPRMVTSRKHHVRKGDIYCKELMAYRLSIQTKVRLNAQLMAYWSEKNKAWKLVRNSKKIKKGRKLLFIVLVQCCQKDCDVHASYVPYNPVV